MSEAKILATQERIAASNRDETELRMALDQAQASTDRRASAEATPKKPVPPVRNRPDLAALLEAKPELRVMFGQSYRAELSVRYLPFFDALKLSPDAVENFKNLMVESEEERLDVQAAAKAQGLTETDPAFAKLQQEQQAKMKAAQLELLGEAGYQQLEEFKRVQPLEQIVGGVANLAGQTSSPLTAPQAERLLNVLARASGAYQAGGVADNSTIDWPRALTEAQSFLSPSQFAALKNDSSMSQGLLQVMTLAKQLYQRETPAK